jgi:hypothetical protein
MGFFKKVKKGLSSAWKGIKKGFKKVMAKVGKFLNSGWGKALMIIAGIVTMGAALAAGAAAYSAAAAAGQGFFSSMVAGGSAVLGSLTGGMVGSAGAGGGAAGGAAASGANTAGQAAKVAQGAEQAAAVSEIAGAAGTVAETAVATGGAAGAAGGGGGALAGGANVAATTASSTGGMLSKAAQGVTNFAKNPIGSALKGAAKVGKGAMDFITGGGAAAPNTAGGISTANMGAGAELAAHGMTQVAQTPGLLAQAGNAAKGLGKAGWDYATSEGGGQMLGKVVEGYSQGRIIEEQAREERKQMRRRDKAWASYDWSGTNFGPKLGEGWAQRANRTATDLNRESQMDYSSSQGADLASGYKRTGTGG